MKKEWKNKKVVIWDDEFHNEFVENNLDHPPVKENYVFHRENKFTSFFSNVVYFFLLKPVLSLYLYLSGTRVIGRNNLKAVKDIGCYLYSNYVSFNDTYKIQALVVQNKRVDVIGYSDISKKKIKGKLAANFGYIPLPLKEDLVNTEKMVKSLDYRVMNKHDILIFPEAHMWPYYTHIRDFKWGSFAYPTRTMSPIVPIVTVFRSVWYSKKPKETIIIGKPIYPKMGFNAHQNKMFLYQECLNAMRKISDSYNQPEYIQYIKKDQ